MHILLTGGTGCLGRALISELSAADHEIIAIVRSASTLAPREGVEFIEMDLSQPLICERLPKKMDVVIHAAQSRRYREFPEGATDMFRINTAVTVELAEYAVAAGASQFVYTSTGSIYEPNPNPIPEAGRVAPRSFYESSKLAAELLLVPYGEILNVLTLRLFYLYGPGQKDMLITNLAKRIKADQQVTLDGERGLLLCPTYSQDVACFVRIALDQTLGGLYNVASNEVIDLRALALKIGKSLDVEPRFEVCNEEPPVPVPPDTTKLAAHMEPHQFTTIESGLMSTLRLG